MRVRVLTECGPGCGNGHLVRCSAVAMALRDFGVEVSFVIRGALAPQLREDADITPDYLETDWADAPSPEAWAAGVDGVIVDSYRASPASIAAIAEGCANSLVFDDHRRITIRRGFLVRPAEEGPLAAGSGEVASVLGGARFQPLRRAFWRDIPYEVRPEVRTALVALGSGALRWSTSQVSRLVRERVPGLQKVVVLGAPPAATAEPVERHEFLGQASLVERMVDTDVAIASASQVSYELARVGVPSILVTTADNQRRTEAYWRSRGAFHLLGEADPASADALAAAIDAACLGREHRLQQSALLRSCVDGQGARRLAFVLRSRMPICHAGVRAEPLVRATPDQQALVWRWRNDQRIRPWMTTTRPITPSEHARFLEGLTADAERYAAIVREGGEPLGVVSLNPIDWQRATAELGLYKNPDLTRHAGEILLRHLEHVAFVVFGLAKLTLRVKTDNLRAIALYARSGYHRTGELPGFLLMEKARGR